MEYYWDEISQWCTARVTEEPTKDINNNNEITVKLYIEDDKFVEESIVLSSDTNNKNSSSKTKWQII